MHFLYWVVVETAASLADLPLDWEANRGGSIRPFWHAWSTECWSWIVSFLSALVASIVASKLARTSRKKSVLGSKKAYALTSDGLALAGGLVQNSVGRAVRINAQGAFRPLAEWQEGSALMVYGPLRSGKRRLLGEYVLRARSNGEWEPIRVGVRHSDL